MSKGLYGLDRRAIVGHSVGASAPKKINTCRIVAEAEGEAEAIANIQQKHRACFQTYVGYIHSAYFHDYLIIDRTVGDQYYTASIQG